MAVSWRSLSYRAYRLTGEEEVEREGGVCGGGGVSPGLCCPQLLYVCLISQFISRAWLSGEPSALAIHQDLPPSHHNWEMRPRHSNSISPISHGYSARQPSQPASTLFGIQKIIKTYQRIRNSSCLPTTAATPSDLCGICRRIRDPLTDISFLSFYIFSPKLNISAPSNSFHLSHSQPGHFSLNLREIDKEGDLGFRLWGCTHISTELSAALWVLWCAGVLCCLFIPSCDGKQKHNH